MEPQVQASSDIPKDDHAFFVHRKLFLMCLAIVPLVLISTIIYVNAGHQVQPVESTLAPTATATTTSSVVNTYINPFITQTSQYSNPFNTSYQNPFSNL